MRIATYLSFFIIAFSGAGAIGAPKTNPCETAGKIDGDGAGGISCMLGKRSIMYPIRRRAAGRCGKDTPGYTVYQNAFDEAYLKAQKEMCGKEKKKDD